MTYNNDLPSAREILLSELEKASWRQLNAPQDVLQTVRDCMENTRLQMTSAFWGNKTRIDACNTLFREAQAGAALAIEAISAVKAEQRESLSKDNSAKPQEAPKDYTQLILLVAGAVCALLGGSFSLSIRKMIFGSLGTLLVIIALMREAGRVLSGDTARSAMRLLGRFSKSKKVRDLADGIADSGLLHADTAPQETVKQLRVSVRIDHDAIEAACVRQMEIIDANLPLFTDSAAKADEGGRLRPLVRIMIQEKYVSDGPFPATVEDELQRYLRANKLTLLDYSTENSGYFQTQRMDETFTIFPAILDEDGRVVEYGVAGVKED